MTPLRRLTSRTAVLASDNVDTDQIIPARFLTTTAREGFGRALFADWRYDRDGRPRPEFVLNAPETEGAAILVAGRNFGCGSSREHAVWALVDHGFRAVISTEIADIFKRNALKNGLLPIEIDAVTHSKLVATPGVTLTIDVEATTLTLPEGKALPFALEPFARHCLLEGVDELGFLLARHELISAYERSAAEASS